MFYIRTADRLTRTAKWLDNLEGGVEKLKQIILDDALGICADLEAEMDALVDTYEDEWATAIKDPEKSKKFKQFVNSVSRLLFFGGVAANYGLAG
jgi:nitrite reductase (NAD(P)H)